MFYQLQDPDFIQLQSLNLSYNDLGPEAVAMLSPLMASIVELNLAGTKLNNQSMNDIQDIFRTTEMRLQKLDLHNNSIGAEGFSKLMFSLKTNNSVKYLDMSKNPVSNDMH